MRPLSIHHGLAEFAFAVDHSASGGGVLPALDATCRGRRRTRSRSSRRLERVLPDLEQKVNKNLTWMGTVPEMDAVSPPPTATPARMKRTIPTRGRPAHAAQRPSMSEPGKGMRGWPLATSAFYRPNASCTMKVVVENPS